MPQPVRKSTTLEQARHAAGSDTVQEIAAASVQPDMTIWHNGRWLPVMYRRITGDAVMLDFTVPEPGGTAYRLLSHDTTMYRRIAGVPSAFDRMRP